MEEHKKFIDIRLRKSKVENKKRQVFVEKITQGNKEPKPVKVASSNIKEQCISNISNNRVQPPKGISSENYINGIFNSKSRDIMNVPAVRKRVNVTNDDVSSVKPDTKVLNDDKDIDRLINDIKNNSIVNTKGKMKKPTELLKQKRTPSQRPSLSEQLSKIGDNAQDITNDIRKVHNLSQSQSNQDKPLFIIPAKSFIVGNLSCRYPSPISFYNNKLIYDFNHPYENKQIKMIMYYKDFIHSININNKNNNMKFKIMKPLEQFGENDYDFNNRSHFIQVSLASGTNLAQVQKVIKEYAQKY